MLFYSSSLLNHSLVGGMAMLSCGSSPFEETVVDIIAELSALVSYVYITSAISTNDIFKYKVCNLK